MANNPLLTSTTADEMLKILDSENYEQAKLLHIWAESAGLKIEPRTGAHYIVFNILQENRNVAYLQSNAMKSASV